MPKRSSSTGRFLKASTHGPLAVEQPKKRKKRRRGNKAAHQREAHQLDAAWDRYRKELLAAADRGSPGAAQLAVARLNRASASIRKDAAAAGARSRYRGRSS